ncbi:MAG TPA: mechanosensitive ion channel family protein, partial [Leptolyngbyaceae cyanobacterium M65_K2018_010]|nr:mechanosensitive ion channel family protein [Leptolyngbyaceae cyanobacterium M65_K2018_010]
MKYPGHPLPHSLRWPSWLWAGLFTLGLALGLGLFPSLAQAQFPNPLGSANNSPPLGVQRIGLLEVTPVSLDGSVLFQIAAPAVLNRNDPGDQVPVEVRAKQIEINLNQVVNQALDYSALESESPAAEITTSDILQVTVEQLNELPVLFATVGNLPEPRGLLTVTDSDAQYHGVSKSVLAERWQGILQPALQAAVELRQP